MNRSSSKRSFKPQLDSLRALAVSAVLIHHFFPTESFTRYEVFNLGLLGLLGVLLFFVLSGYLITGLLLRYREQHWRNALTLFYVRRILRIFPIYYLTLLILFVLQAKPASDFLSWHASYVSNVLFVLQPQAAADSAHFWSLSVEEQFYLIWPLIILLTAYKHLFRIIIWTILIGLCWKLFIVKTLGDHLAGALPVVSCLDSLGLGAALAFVEHDETLRRKRRHLLLSFLIVGGGLFLLQILLMITGAFRGLVLITGFIGPSLVFAWLVGSAADGFSGVVGRWLESRSLLYFGKISYAIYLFHNFMPRLVRYFVSVLGLHQPNELMMFVYATSLTVLAAAMSWHFIEEPIRRAKNRLAPDLVVGG